MSLFTGDEGGGRIKARHHAPMTPARSAGRERVCGSYLFSAVFAVGAICIPASALFERNYSASQSKKEALWARKQIIEN